MWYYPRKKRGPKLKVANQEYGDLTMQCKHCLLFLQQPFMQIQHWYNKSRTEPLSKKMSIKHTTANICLHHNYLLQWKVPLCSKITDWGAVLVTLINSLTERGKKMKVKLFLNIKTGFVYRISKLALFIRRKKKDNWFRQKRWKN